MLRPLLFLSALAGLTGAQQTSITNSAVVNISSCPFIFYGVTYDTVYVELDANVFAVCFKGMFSTTADNDCITGPQVVSRTADLTVGRASASERSRYENSLLIPAGEPLGCKLDFRNLDTNSEYFFLRNFGNLAVLHLFTARRDTKVYNIIVNGDQVFNFALSSDVTSAMGEINGCRDPSGGGHTVGSQLSYDPLTCHATVCNSSALISEEPTCDPTQLCVNASCQNVNICTMVAQTVIDFDGEYNIISDRCAYHLLSDNSTDFFVTGLYKERRRTDVSFLDALRLTHGHTFTLSHVGELRVDGEIRHLSREPTDIGGLEFSKDESGVTVKFSAPSDYNVTLFFDGTVAQITVLGTSSLSGLCTNSRNVTTYREEHDNCLDYYGDYDPTINCTEARLRCSSFYSQNQMCHEVVDPGSYLETCQSTMCTYRAVDGLSCKFFESYSRACSVYRNQSDSWRTSMSCPPPQGFCGDRICSDNEFCAQTLEGENACFCRGLFALPYRWTGVFGGTTVCEENSASLTMLGCLMEESGVDYTTLHLNDENCTGHINEANHMVTFGFNSSSPCGTVVSRHNSQLVYQNTIINVWNTSIITHHDQVHIDFSCYYEEQDRALNFRIRHNSVIVHIISGVWNYTLTMKAYANAAHTELIDTEVQLNQRIWVGLETTGLDEGMVAVVIDSCWATDRDSPSGGLRYNLIENSCANPTDSTVTVERNGQGTSSYFSFDMFEFLGVSSDIYLHCHLHLCGVLNKSCVPTCTRPVRRRRSARLIQEDENPAHITMTWTK